MNRWPSGCSRITSISGSRPCDRPCARRLRTVSTACPDSSSFCISSKSRAGGNVLHQRRELRDRRGRLGVDGDAELRGEPHGAQHAHRVLAQARHRRADQLQAPRADVGDAADVVPHFLGRRVEVERVDREVAPRRVLGLRAVDVVGKQPAVLVGRVVAGLRGAKRRDLDRFRPDMDVDEPESAADDEGAAEQRLHLLRARVGGDVEILGLDAEQEVADRAADDERLEAGVVQLARHLERPAAQLRAADRVVAGPVDARRAGFVPSGQEAGEQAANRHAIGMAQRAGAGVETNGCSRSRRRTPPRERQDRGVIECAAMIARAHLRNPRARPPAQGRRWSTDQRRIG